MGNSKPSGRMDRGRPALHQHTSSQLDELLNPQNQHKVVVVTIGINS
jgi:hypothetical protein